MILRFYCYHDFTTFHNFGWSSDRMCLQPFPRRQILDSSKLNEFADENFKIDENGWKFYNRVEYTVGVGENPRYEQFLLFPRCFRKSCTANM